MRINGKELFVEDLGNKNGEAILFLNGVMATTSSWYQIIAPFVNLGYRVILHDFKGQLKSDKPEGPYTFKEHADETVELMNALAIKQAIIVGTSYGGEVGLRLAAYYPERVKKLAVIASVSELDEHMVLVIKDWIKLAKEKDGYEFFWGMCKSIYHPQFIAENRPFLEKRALALAGINPDYFKGQITLYETFLNDVTLDKELDLIKAPTLMISAADDKLKPPRFSEIMRQKIKDSKHVIIKDAAHVVILEKPQEIIDALLEFIH